MKICPPSGPPDADVVIVGRDSGALEMMKGAPFVGPAGKLLDKGLARVGLSRTRFLVTNVVLVQPRANEWKWHRPEDVTEGVEGLRLLLAQKERKLIVALGEQAFHACLGLDPDAKEYGITEARGYVFDGPFGPVLPSLHPASCLYQWHPNWRLLCFDLEKVRKFLEGVPPLSRRAEWVRNEEVAENFCAEVVQREVIGVDIETYEDTSIACIGVGTAAGVGMTFPWEGRYFSYIERILGSPCKKFFHNGQFDVTILRRAGFEVQNWHDTMLMWHVLEPALSGQKEGKARKRTEKSLRMLASVLTWEPFWKDYSFWAEEERYALCAKDARVTLECGLELERRLHEPL